MEKNLIQFFKKGYNYEHSMHNKNVYKYSHIQNTFLRVLEKCHNNKYFNISINNNLYKKSILNEIDNNNKIIISCDNTAILYITYHNLYKYNEEYNKYKNILFIGPVKYIGNKWLYKCKKISNLLHFCLVL